MADTSAFAPCHSGAGQLGGSEEDSSFGGSHDAAHSTGLSQESDACVCWLGRQVSGHSAIRVKNTFIQAYLVDEDSDEEDELPMVAVRTCPLVRMCSSSTMCTSADEGSSDDSPAPRRPAARPRGAEQRAAPCQGEAAQELPRAEVVPLELRAPEISAGSSLHGMGQCKPCAWFWRPQGCENGSECRHCHLCAAGELKVRKKARVSAARKSCRKSSDAAPRRRSDLPEEPQARQ